jgi:hypothetical protein
MLVCRSGTTAECLVGEPTCQPISTITTPNHPFMICPSCVGLPMYVKDVAPHWSMAKIDFTYECSDWGAEIIQTMTKPELPH